ncbi:MAG TPA: SMI1/KNR4 family protein, partial [Tepidisphaeraceae bacterium]|nr:SMI1/KNR4 family protein [Tepidisphaeraceae bacterium]
PVRRDFQVGEKVFSVHQFFSMFYGQLGTRLEDVYKDLVLTDGILPGRLIPFADDSGGDFYCIISSGPDAGAIVIFRGEYLENDRSRAFERIAKSLPEFINGMQSID